MEKLGSFRRGNGATSNNSSYLHLLVGIIVTFWICVKGHSHTASASYRNDCRTFCGAPQYMPPEVIAFAVPCCNYDLCGYGKNADLWSLGIVRYVMVCAAEPFAEEGLYDSIMSVDVDVDNEEWHAVSSSAAIVMWGLLRYAHSARMSATSILELVNTEWPSIDHAIQ